MSICSLATKGCKIITITAVLFGATAHAATKSADMTVQFNVNTDCTIAVDGPLDFGTISTALSADVDAATSLTVNCSAGVNYDIAMGAGLSGDAANRHMVGANTGATVSCGLYQDAGRTQLWGNTVGADTLGGQGNGADQTINVYGRVPSQATTPPADRYTDSVTVTLIY